MPKTIEPKLRKIGEYLKLSNNTVFSIPAYQRPYSWTTEQCDKLWQDIEDFDGINDYFFGTIIIDCGDDRYLNLIDGQQRTTTFILLLKAILIKLIQAANSIPQDEQHEGLINGVKTKRNEIMKILYRAEDENIHKLLKDFTKAADFAVIINNSINEAETHKDETSRILSAADINAAEKIVHKIPRRQKDNRYSNYFRNFKFFWNKLKNMDYTGVNSFAKKFLEKCEVIEIRSWNFEQAITMFNSLNSDGLPLSDSDIISAQMYHEAGTQREEFSNDWEALLEIVNELKSDKVVDIDSILMQYMYIERAKNKEYMRDGATVDVTVSGVRRYYTDKERGLLTEPLALCGKLRKLANVWLLVKDFSIVKLALKFNSNIRYFMAGFFSRYETANDVDRDEIDRICLCLIKLFTLLELVDAGYSSSRFKTFLFQLNIKLVDSAVRLYEIERDLTSHIDKYWKREDIKGLLVEYNKNILVYLNEYLYAPSKFDLTVSCDVEHIMPASGSNVDSIRADAGIVDKGEFKDLVSLIGNKILLEANINRVISNDWFKTKIQSSVTCKAGYLDSGFAIASELAKSFGRLPNPLWRKAEIKNATNKATERIIEFVFGRAGCS